MKNRKLSEIIARRLLAAILAAFLGTALMTFILVYRQADENAAELVRQNAYDVSCEIAANTAQSLVTMYSDTPREYLQNGPEAYGQRLRDSGSEYTFFTDQEGIVTVCAVEEYIGQDAHTIDEVGDIIDAWKDLDIPEDVLLGNITSEPVYGFDRETPCYYIVISIPNRGGFFVTGKFREEYEFDLISTGGNVTDLRHIGRGGFIVLADQEKRVLCSPTEEHFLNDIPNSYLIDIYLAGDSSLKTYTFPSYSQGINAGEIAEVPMLTGKDRFWGTGYYYAMMRMPGSSFFVYCFYPVREALGSLYTTMAVILVLEIVIFAVLFLAVKSITRRTVVIKLDSVNSSLGEITRGNLEERVEVRDSREFNQLSDDINATVDRLKEYIEEAAARIDADLAVAKAIQSSALPNVFPPFPERKEFELYASMHAAKEVGGDFYDFFLLGDETLGFLIADVSGKSIPGAMFMMTAKTVIKSLAESGLPPAEVFTAANEKLCEGNDAEMFLTAWMGYLDLRTGLVHVANAGHNPPVLIHGGVAQYVVLKPGLMLAGMDGMLYKEQTVQLEEGDILFLYTDGVTEAMDTEEKLYGEDRLVGLLSFGDRYPEPAGDNGIAGAVCDMVAADITVFVQGAEQSDDITMLCVRYMGDRR